MIGPQRAIVIGAGLAGSTIAAALARQGRPVVLIADPAAPAAASAVPLAVMTPAIAPAADPLTRLRRLGLRLTRAWMHHLDVRGLDCGRVADGVLILPQRPRERARRDRLRPGARRWTRLDPDSAESLAGFRPAEDVILHRDGGCLVPARFARGLLTDAGTRVERIDGRVSAIERRGNGWVARDERTVLATGDVLVLAAGAHSTRLWSPAGAWLQPARGQATAFAPTPETAALRLPLSGGGYVTPAVDGLQWAGATLQRGDADPEPRAADDAFNARFVQRLFALDRPPEPLARFVGIRATTPDRLPLVGALADGLWISAGHGSHGLLTAPAAAHVIAQGIQQRRPPWIARLLDPQRRKHGPFSDTPAPTGAEGRDDRRA